MCVSQGGSNPKVQQSAVAQCAAPQVGPGCSDDIGPVDRAVADLLYNDPVQQRLPAFPGGALFAAPCLESRPRPAASDQASGHVARRGAEPPAGPALGVEP